MQSTLRFEPAIDFKDPRLVTGFDRTAWPRCNGRLAPKLGAKGLHEKRCLEFLALYYRLNVLNKNLLAARRKAAPTARIKSVLAKIHTATTELERLEDRYTPIGFFGEPIMDGVFYRDIKFTRPELPRIAPSLHSSHIAIPGLEQIPPSELRGPAKIIRFGHGKMDL